MFFDIFRWWLVVQALGLSALPLSLWFLRRLPDRGYSFAKAFGLLLTGYGAWLLSMLGVGAFESWLLVLVALLIAGLGLALLGRDGWRSGLAELRARLPWIGFQEVLFAVALYGGVWLRWYEFFGYGAGIQHTEQPMDLTFLSGILASQQFPPQDPWLAGYPINYYYLGYLLVAGLIRLAGVGVGVGYTLGFATIFALTAVGVAGIVRNLIELTEAASNHPASDIAASPVVECRAWRPGRWLAPLLGVVLVLLAGNQAGALQVLAGSEKVVALEPQQLAQAVVNGVSRRAVIDLPPPFPVGPGNFDSAQITPGNLGNRANFNRWWPSRAVWDDLPRPNGVSREYAITEFPFFSFLLGDLHPHVLSLPWSLLALALALNVLARNVAPDFRTRGGWVQLALTGIVLGGLYAINSWDLPAYLLIYLGALVLLYLRLAPTPRGFFWPHFVQQAGATVVACYVMYFPFHLAFAAPTEDSPIGISPARTGLVEFFVIFGLFCVPLVAYVIRHAFATSHTPSIDPPVLAPRPTLLMLGGVLLLGIVVGWPLFVLLPLAIWAIATAYTQREQPATAFVLWLFAVGALIVWGTDVIYLRDNYSSPRMNTLFKFYYQVWLLWGAVAAFAVWALMQRLRARSALWLLPTAVLLAGALVYPILGPSANPPARTLDGLAYLQQDAPGEAAAINWVRANTAPTAVIVQAPGVPYQAWTARLASATGRPTLVGWTQHERLWRRGQPELVDQVAAREQDVRTLYTTTDPQLAQSILGRYNATYVYVGPNEQRLIQEQNAPPEALTKFDSFMSRVFEQDGAIIFQIR